MDSVGGGVVADIIRDPYSVFCGVADLFPLAAVTDPQFVFFSLTPKTYPKFVLFKHVLCFARIMRTLCPSRTPMCTCKLCNSPADHKSHIMHCRWATKDEPFELNVSNINIIVNMLQCMNTT